MEETQFQSLSWEHLLKKELVTHTSILAYVFPVVTYGCESWTIKKVQDLPKNWCFWTLELEKTLESPLDSKEIKPVNLKENQPWIFIGRNDAEAEAPVLWPPDVKSLFIGKNPDAGKDWGQEKRVTEDEMVGWHHQLHGHVFEQTLGDSGGPGTLVCCIHMGLQRVGHDQATEQQHHLYVKSKIWHKWTYVPNRNTQT